MFSRLPLPFKILLWFFLNVALLLAGFGILFSTEYRFNLDWIYASHAQQRVEAMRDLLVDDLDTHSPEEWDEVIERFADAYHVRLALFDERGAHLLGSVDGLPAEVRLHMRERPRYPDPAPDASPSPSTRDESVSATKSLIRTTDPTTRYWLVVAARVDNPRLGTPMHVNVVAQSSSVSMGGLIIDPTPWLRLGVAAIVFSVLFWLPLLRGITRAIGQATRAAHEIAAGRLDARVASRRRDELGVLADAINQMAARLDGLLRGQKRFLGDVAHELCAPLARLQMTLGILEQQSPADPQRTYVQTAMTKAEQMARLVDELLVFSRAALGTAAHAAHAHSPVNLLHAAREVVAQETTGPGADIRLEIPADCLVLADRDSLLRALGNLLRNALRYGGPTSPVVIRAIPDRGQIALSVADRGPGVPDPDLPKIFDAFYRVDTARTRETGGVGLGLSIVKASVESGGGTVTARNRAGGGLEVILRLPPAPSLEPGLPR